MKIERTDRIANEMDTLCTRVRNLVANGEYEGCIEPICKAMEQNPHAPQPHNLLGIVLEKLGDHLTAMKHFRAAWALDPTYTPAFHNLDTYGTFFSHGECAFDESDVVLAPLSSVEIIYDERGIGRVVSKRKIEYDERGIGHGVRR